MKSFLGRILGWQASEAELTGEESSPSQRQPDSGTPERRPKLPEMEYPSPFIVRNTFIDTGRSLVSGIQPREIHSCPVSVIGEADVDHEGLHTDCERVPEEKVCEGSPGDSTVRSGSTFAGDLSPPSSLGDGSDASSPAPARPGPDGCLSPAYVYPATGSTKSVPGLPEFEYPSPFSVTTKNTFIHAGIGRPLSLDGFLEEREIHSAPVSALFAPPLLTGEESGLDPETLAAAAAAAAGTLPVATPTEYNAGPRSGATSLLAPGTTAEGLPTIPPPPAEPPLLAMEPQAPVLPPPPQAPSLEAPEAGTHVDVTSSAAIISLVEGVPEPVPGSPELPSVGSARHRFNDCSPCAHAHSAKGCRNGAECPFCHLCEAGELKRRQKLKRSAQRLQQRVDATMAQPAFLVQ